jgi:hypothetical protein
MRLTSASARSASQRSSRTVRRRGSRALEGQSTTKMNSLFTMARTFGGSASDSRCISCHDAHVGQPREKRDCYDDRRGTRRNRDRVDARARIVRACDVAADCGFRMRRQKKFKHPTELCRRATQCITPVDVQTSSGNLRNTDNSPGGGGRTSTSQTVSGAIFARLNCARPSPICEPKRAARPLRAPRSQP